MMVQFRDKMFLHFFTQLLLAQLIAATTSQYIQQPFPYYNQAGPQMSMMPNGPQMMQMSNGPPMMQMPNGPPMMQMPNGQPMIPHLPRLPGMSPPMHPMHLPMPFPPNGRLPMVVMPHYSKKADKPLKKPHKPKRKRIKMESSSSEGSCSESEEYRSRNSLRTAKKRREVLTPVVSYVTKDGYVVYQKKIKKDKAKDWLELTKSGSREYKDKIRFKKREH